MNNPTPDLESTLFRLSEVRKEREELQGQLAGAWAESRSLALTLVFEFAYSVHLTAKLTGHTRASINEWIRVEAQRRGMPAFKPLPDS